jgi:hypothetical protein
VARALTRRLLGEQISDLEGQGNGRKEHNGSAFGAGQCNAVHNHRHG